MFPEQPCGFHSLIFRGTAHRLTPTSPDSGLESLPRETKESIKHSKILNAFLFLFDKMLVYRAGIHKMFVKIANREDPDQKEAV